MRIFDSDAYVYMPKKKHTKFDPRTKKLMLVGYDSESSNYRCYDLVTKVVSVSRHVAFNERESRMGSEVPVSQVELTLSMQSEIEEEDYQDAEDGNPAVLGNAGTDDVAADNARAKQPVERVEEDETENVDNVRQQQEQEAPVLRALRDQAIIRQPKR